MLKESYHKQQSNHKSKEKLTGRDEDIRITDNESMLMNSHDNKHLHAIKPYNSKQRKKSKREISSSPAELIRSKSKKCQQQSLKMQETLNSKQMTDLYTELINLKNEYKGLKNSYTKLICQKKQIITKFQKQKMEAAIQIDRLNSKVESYIKQSLMKEQEIERIKKESYKIIENEKFKNKKLEQTLQQKQLMIAFLKNQLASIKRNDNSANSSLIFLQNSLPFSNYEYFQKKDYSVFDPLKEKYDKLKRSFHEQDSLSFSREHESLNSFLTIDRAPLYDTIIQDQDEICSTEEYNQCKTNQFPTFSKKQNYRQIQTIDISDSHKNTIQVPQKSSVRQKISKLSTKRNQNLEQNRDLNQPEEIKKKLTSIKQKKKTVTHKKKN